MKQLKVTIPDGMTVANYHETLDPKGHVVISYDLHSTFKDGDILVIPTKTAEKFFIYKKPSVDNHTNSYLTLFSNGRVLKFDFIKNINLAKLATENEKVLFIELLNEQGIDFDFEYKKIITYKWRANEGEIFYYIDDCGEIVECIERHSPHHDKLYSVSNYFASKLYAEILAGCFKMELKFK